MALRSPCLLVLTLLLVAPYCRSQEQHDPVASLQGIQSQFEKLVTQMAETREELIKLKESQDLTRNDLRTFMDGRCSTGSHNCSINAICTDLWHGYRCECLKGFSGDGFNCTDINECVNGNHDCSRHATCENTIGSYICQCMEGFEGDGNTCVDVDECSLLGEHNCSTSETCINTYGNFCCNESGTGNDPECDCISPFTYEEGLGCLYLEDNKASWDTARALCQLRGGGDLFVLGEGKQRQFSDYLVNIPSSYSNDGGVWVGAQRRTWLNGRPMTKDDWRITVRRGWEGDECVMAKLRFPRWALGSMECDEALASICQLH